MRPTSNGRNISIYFVSINSLSIIPVVRFIISYLSDFHFVYLTECYISGNYTFSKLKKSWPIYKFKNHRSFYRQKSWFKIYKYITIIRRIIFINIINKRNKLIYTPDFQVLYFAILIKKFFRNQNLKIIYHQFEQVDINVLKGLNLIFFKYCLKNGRKIDLCIFPEINRANYFKEKAGIDYNKVYVFPNTCLPKDEYELIRNNETKNPFIVGHIGNFGLDHFTKELFQVIEELSDFAINFMFIGHKADEVEKLLRNLKNPNVLSIDAVPHNELHKFYQQINLGLILYKGIDLNFEYCAPNKLYEYWSNGIPVVAHKLQGLIPVYTNSYIGKLIDFNNVEELKQTILYYFNNRAILPSNREIIIDFFNKNLAIDSFLSHLKKKIQLLFKFSDLEQL